MSEKKNIVIKVKYPNPNALPEKGGFARNQVTEWNVKRIALAAGCLVLLLGVFYSALKPDVEEQGLSPASQPTATADIKDKPQQEASGVKTEPLKPAEENVVQDVKVVRALLTNTVDRNEPGKAITPPLQIGKKEAFSIYYFVELKGMKGKTIYHEWYLNDKLVSRKKVNISADPWRTSSKQRISYTMNNDWKVRLTDEKGRLLNEKKFNLELK